MSCSKKRRIVVAWNGSTTTTSFTFGSSRRREVLCGRARSSAWRTLQSVAKSTGWKRFSARSCLAGKGRNLALWGSHGGQGELANSGVRLGRRANHSRIVLQTSSAWPKKKGRLFAAPNELIKLRYYARATIC